jgi:hypothetical protein
MGTYYKAVEKYFDKIDSGSWLEIGVDRGEGSTRFFSDSAGKRGVKFYGVDADPDQVSRSLDTLRRTGQASIGPDGSINQILGDLPAHVSIVHNTGEKFLDEFAQQHPTERFSLVYLDNFDWDYWVGGEEESFVPAQKQRYEQIMGVQMNNLNSQIAHFLQAFKLQTMMTEHAIIVCDDTWYHPREGVFIGKCSVAIPLLLLNGYKILESQGYRQNSGVILGKIKE